MKLGKRGVRISGGPNLRDIVVTDIESGEQLDHILSAQIRIDPNSRHGLKVTALLEVEAEVDLEVLAVEVRKPENDFTEPLNNLMRAIKKVCLSAHVSPERISGDLGLAISELSEKHDAMLSAAPKEWKGR
jgi:hypothetical protein